jgi:glycosyltransferase involved in cell wall biosynthesis
MLAADAFVLSSRVETFGVVVVEALATGMPVIATRSGGPECIVTLDDGLLVGVGDVEGLGEAMVRLRDTVSRYDASDLKARCATRFGEAAFVSAVEGVYERVIKVGEA